MSEALNVLQAMVDNAGEKASRLLSQLTLSAVTFCIVVVTALAGAGCIVAALFFALQTMYSLPVALAFTGLACFVPVAVFCVYLFANGRQARPRDVPNASSHARISERKNNDASARREAISGQTSDVLVAQQLVHCLNDAVEKYPIRSIAAATLAGWAMSQTGIIDEIET